MVVDRQLADARRQRIAAVLAERGSARVADLARICAVATITIRRDLRRMEADGLIERVHGGARVVPGDSAPGYGSGDPPMAEPHLRGQVAMLVPALDFYWPSVARGAEAEARRYGLRLMLRGDSYGSLDERPMLAPLFESTDVTGVLAVLNQDRPDAADVIEWVGRRRQPCILLEREAVAPSTHQPVESVVSDHSLGAEMAVRYLWELGHRDIGLVVSRESPTTRKIRIGFTRVCDELGIDTARQVDAVIPSTRTPGFAAAADAVVESLRDRPSTALLVHSDREAMGLAQCMEVCGMKVPRDVSIVAYDDEVASMFSPALTAIRPAREALGRAAVRLLVERLCDPGRPVHRVLISPELHIRESTVPYRAR
jgi:DNA-binding LacI/PurR family transcriptional regulator